MLVEKRTTLSLFCNFATTYTVFSTANSSRLLLLLMIFVESFVLLRLVDVSIFSNVSVILRLREVLMLFRLDRKGLVRMEAEEHHQRRLRQGSYVSCLYSFLMVWSSLGTALDFLFMRKATRNC
jgi:hypothetical protein